MGFCCVLIALTLKYFFVKDRVLHYKFFDAQVFDGSKTGFDLSYQPSNKRVSANWNGFGEKSSTSQVSQNETSSSENA